MALVGFMQITIGRVPIRILRPPTTLIGWFGLSPSLYALIS